MTLNDVSSSDPSNGKEGRTGHSFTSLQQQQLVATSAFVAAAAMANSNNVIAAICLVGLVGFFANMAMNTRMSVSLHKSIEELGSQLQVQIDETSVQADLAMLRSKLALMHGSQNQRFVCSPCSR